MPFTFAASRGSQNTAVAVIGGGVNEKIVDANVRHYQIELVKISDAKVLAEASVGL